MPEQHAANRNGISPAPAAPAGSNRGVLYQMSVFWVANLPESWQVLQKLMTDEFWSDLMRAVAIMVAGPVFLLVLPLAWLKQALRRRLHAEYGQVTYTHIYVISYTYVILYI